jgi:hypothetical protein
MNWEIIFWSKHESFGCHIMLWVKRSLKNNYVMLYWQIFNKRTFDMFWSKNDFSIHISLLRICLRCDIALRNPLSQNKSTIVYIYCWFVLKEWISKSNITLKAKLEVQWKVILEHSLIFTHENTYYQKIRCLAMRRYTDAVLIHGWSWLKNKITEINEK